MRDSYPETNDAHWEDLTPSPAHLPLPLPPLSPRGQERQAEILAAMERASGRRRLRARAVRVAAAFAVCSSAALVARYSLTPAPHRPGVVVKPDSGAETVVHPAPSGSNTVAQVPRAVVVAEYIGTKRGIAERVSSDLSHSRVVTAQRLTDGALTRMLAEQTTFGLAEVQGRVIVLDNQASAELSPSVH